MADEPIKIFYSWQSWTPNARNKNFIENVLGNTLNEIEEPNGRSIVIDRDTKGLPGIPAIADAIFKKIEQCDIFLADVTIVISNDEHKSPNPNVLLELGYAIKCLGWDRIILVMNKSFGEPNSLPFDFQHRRWPLTYQLETGNAKAIEKQQDQLIGGLKVAIETILHSSLPSLGETTTEAVERHIEEGNHVSLDKLLRNQINKIDEKISLNEFYEHRGRLLNDSTLEKRVVWDKGLDLYFHKIQADLAPFLSLCWYGSSNEQKHVSIALIQWMQEKSNDPLPKTSWKYVSSCFLVYIVGIAAVANEKWNLLSIVLLNKPSKHDHISDAVIYSFDLIAENFIHYYQFDQRTWNSSQAYPVGKYMQATLRPIFKNFISLDESFYETFDIFEFIVALHHFDIRFNSGLHNPLFLRTSNYTGYGDRSNDAIISFLNRGAKEEDNWNLLKVGLFGGSSQRFIKVLEGYQERLIKSSNQFDFPLQFPDYLAAYKSRLNTK